MRFYLISIEKVKLIKPYSNLYKIMNRKGKKAVILIYHSI